MQATPMPSMQSVGFREPTPKIQFKEAKTAYEQYLAASLLLAEYNRKGYHRPGQPLTLPAVYKQMKGWRTFIAERGSRVVQTLSWIANPVLSMDSIEVFKTQLDKYRELGLTVGEAGLFAGRTCFPITLRLMAEVVSSADEAVDVLGITVDPRENTSFYSEVAGFQALYPEPQLLQRVNAPAIGLAAKLSRIKSSPVYIRHFRS